MNQTVAYIFNQSEKGDQYYIDMFKSIESRIIGGNKRFIILKDE